MLRKKHIVDSQHLCFITFSPIKKTFPICINSAMLSKQLVLHLWKRLTTHQHHGGGSSSITVPQLIISQALLSFFDHLKYKKNICVLLHPDEIMQHLGGKKGIPHLCSVAWKFGRLGTNEQQACWPEQHLWCCTAAGTLCPPPLSWSNLGGWWKRCRAFLEDDIKS